MNSSQGATPLKRDLENASYIDVLKHIREDEWERPSERLRSRTTIEAAAQRRSDPVRLPKLLRGELDWITMKALEKDRTRRYETVNALGRDLHRYLEEEPVDARPPSAAYRISKFVRRHRFGVAVASGSVFAVFVLAVIMTVMAARIAQERDRANQQAQAKERIAEFLQDLFKVSEPTQSRGNTVTAREILDDGVKKIDETLTDDDEVKADLIATMGDVYTSLGLYVEAERLARRALDLQRNLHDKDSRYVIGPMSALGWIGLQQGRYEEAVKIFSDVLDKQKALYGAQDKRTLRTKNSLALTYTRQGRLMEASELFKEVTAEQRRVLGSDDPETLAALSNLAILYRKHGQVAEAIKLQSEVLEARKRRLGEDHPDTITSMNNLATYYQTLRNYDAARALLERAAELAEKTWGPKHPNYATLVHSLGELESDMGNLRIAELRLLQAIAIYDLQPSHQHALLALYQLAQVSARQGKTVQALNYVSSALARGYKHNGKALGFADDPNLNSLHPIPRFQQMVADIARREQGK
jgi:non-specific serine/threonine protein kinase/serine/threonine-protein kinase